MLALCTEQNFRVTEHFDYLMVKETVLRNNVERHLDSLTSS